MTLRSAFVIARKEVVDHLRDRRSLLLGVLYALMGPIFVGFILFARMSDGGAAVAQQNNWVIMASVFALVAALTGGMSVAMDVVAGERERRSLLPLLLGTPSRAGIVIGKWLAVSVYAVAGLLVCVLAFQAIFHAIGTTVSGDAVQNLLVLVPGFVALALLAGAVEILGSTICRNLKEAQTWLSMAMFIAMGISMAMAFRPQLAGDWWYVVPIAGHQRLMQLAFTQEPLPGFEILILSIVSLGVAVVALAITVQRFHRDEIVYSG